MGGVADGIVGEIHGSQRFDIGWADLGNFQRHFFRPRAETLVGFGQFRLPPVVLEVFGLGRVVGLRPEVVRVGLDSVVAMVGGGDDDREHFALGAGEFRRAEHRRLVKFHRRLERGGAAAHDFEDVVNASGPPLGLVVFGFQIVGGLVRLDDANVRHARLLGLGQALEFSRFAGELDDAGLP